MLFTPTRCARHAVAPLGVLLLVVPVGCGGSTAAGAAMPGAAMGGPAMSGIENPIRTTEADWQGVAQALGRTGKVTDNSVYRVSLPRTDLHVVSLGVPIKPGLSFGGYATFTRYRDGTMLMGI
jgi:hypothetical protein